MKKIFALLLACTMLLTLVACGEKPAPAGEAVPTEGEVHTITLSHQYAVTTALAPCYSNLKAMKLAGLRLQDIDVIECNEAFAAQNLGVIYQMQKESGEVVNQTKWNPNGGALAIGHPNGASGARISIFAMRHLEKQGGRYGIISACCGGGLGATTIVENLRK